MLSKDALSQLSSLKDNIASEKEIVEATVRGTAKRFGFARLDDGRDAFLEPDEMVRVLPGDRVRVSLSENNRGQLEGTLEELIESPLDRFVGRYVKKGQAHFVEPDLKPFGRWLFIPPQERTNCAEGDLVECQMIRHPFRYEGRAQVRVLNRIGRPEEIGIEGRYIAAKFDLPEQWPEQALEQMRAIKENPPQLDDERDDLTELPLVTIDSEFTRDMDDAVHARRLDDGWALTSAIADPGAYIEASSPLERTARERATTLYLLGHPISMLPTELSHDILSLVPGEDRPALVCELQIASSGEVRDYRFRQAMIRSHHKLSYQGVTQLIETGEADTELPEAVTDSLKALHEVSEARLAYRQQHALVMEDRADYQYWLNDQKKIERIEKRTRNIAQKMVEEAMLVTNICAGDLFSQHPETGLFSTHVGFRPERLDDARQMSAEVYPELADTDFSQLPAFQSLFRHLRQTEEPTDESQALLSILQRLQQAGSLSDKAAPHFGLGFDTYATVTSPIRRYHDLFNHYALKAILKGTKPPFSPAELAEPTQEKLGRGRQASRQLEQWLLCQYLADRVGTVHFGTIVGVSPNGISVRLDEVGTNGFVRLSEKGQPRPKFDSRRLTLTTETARYRLDEPVTVKIESVDTEGRNVNLSLVDQDLAERLRAFEDKT